MNDCVASLSFNGAVLRVEADSASRLAALVGPHERYRCGMPAGSPHVVLTVSTSAPPLPDSLVETYAGRLHDGTQGRLLEDGHHLAILNENGTVTLIDQLNGRANTSLPSGAEPRFNHGAMMAVIDTALYLSGQQLVHAASLEDPATGAAFLLIGPSGVGKTTTSLALARKRFALMSDDASVLCTIDGRTMVWGMARTPKVHRDTAALLPWLGGIGACWDANGEQGLGEEALAASVALSSRDCRPVVAIVALAERSPDDHLIEPMGKADMLAMLSHDNVAGRPGGMTRKAKTAFERFATLVASTPCLRLRVGQPIDSLDAALAAALPAARRAP